MQAVIDSSAAGIAFLFGPVIPKEGTGTTFAFQVLPVIVSVAYLTAVLHHLGILQLVVRFVGGSLATLLGDRTSVESAKCVTVRVYRGGSGLLNKKIINT